MAVELTCPDLTTHFSDAEDDIKTQRENFHASLLNQRDIRIHKDTPKQKARLSFLKRAS
ncbi:hypothetical protein AB00_3078 [Raoultella ornithinolytica 2-156-04_S1_C1]|nr:hypothetical protein AB00_3078 [Raoultella ornithinolytica 2-156-04_S1_C1]